VTLEADNVTWLKGRAGASGGSVSGLLDQIVTAARKGARMGEARSVVGTIDVDSSDPLLDAADAALSGLFEGSLGRPLVVREARSAYRSRAKKPRRGRG